MQNGQVGVIIIIASLMFSIGGGFLLNTTDVTACETDFTYVTDVAGAFTGTQGNIEIEHNPTENISGYSVFNPNSTEWRSSTVSGITYTQTNPNGYWIQRATGDPVTQTLTISHNLSQNGGGSGTVTYNYGSGTSPTSTITGEWGLNNAEIRTIIFVEGSSHVRVAGVTLYDLVNSYKTWKGISAFDTNSIRIYFNNSQDDYPGFITNKSFDIYRVTSGGFYGLNNEVKYSEIKNDVVVNPTNGSVSINGVSYSWNDVYAVWGDSNVTSTGLTMILGGQVVTDYIDPLYGVKPISVTVDDPTQQGDIANAIHVGGTFTVPASNERTFTATITYKDESGSDSYSLFSPTIQHFSNGVYAVHNGNTTLYEGNQNSDLIVYWDWNSSNPTVVKIWINSSTMPSNAKSVSIGTVPSQGIYQLRVSFDSYGTNISDVVSTLINMSVTPTTSTSNTGGGSFEYITTYNLPAHVTYTDTYWCNKVENSKVTIAIQKPTQATDNVMFAQYKLKDGSTVTESFRLKYDNGWYFYDESNNLINLGEWPGMLLTIRISNGQHYYILTPIQSFINFQNFTIINREYTYLSSMSAPVENPNYESLKFIKFSNTDQPYPYHEVISTTIFLKDGGLYLNDGWFSPDRSFPNDKIIQFRIMSAVRVGESVTITVDQSGYAHDGEPVEVDGSYTYTQFNLMYGYLPTGVGTIDTTSIPGLTIGSSDVGGTPHLWMSGRATTDGIYYVTVMEYNGSSDPATEYVMQFIVMGAENPSPYSRTFMTNTLGTGLYIEGKLYSFSDISLYYVSEDTPAVAIEGQTYAGGLYLNGQFLDKGHLYLIAGKNGDRVIDLGLSTNAWTVQLNGLWAMSTAYYTGENKATSVVVWEEPGTWHWDANLTLIVFIASNIIGMVVCTRFANMSIWDWVIPICACVVAVFMVG